MSPVVSVLVPVYNAGVFLRPALMSVLQQTYQTFEIIIVDDGSTDGAVETISSIKDSRVRILRQKNSGKPTALNRAMEAMTGDFCAIQDADDISQPKRLEAQVRAFMENSKVGAVFTGHDLLIGERRVAPRMTAKGTGECLTDIQKMRLPAHDPTVMYRAAVARSIKFDARFPGCEGVDHVLRVGEQHPLLVLGECLYSYRINPNSVTNRKATDIVEMLRIIHQEAAFRRGVEVRSSEVDVKRPQRFPQYGIVSHFIESVVQSKQCSRSWFAFKTALQCARLNPRDPLYYKPLAFAVSPLQLITRYRRLKEAAGTAPTARV